VSDRQTADEGFHEIQLSGKQIVFLFMATTVVSVVIFLCGVLVGRGVQIQRTAEAEQAASDPTAAAPAAAPAETAAQPDAEILTYPQRLEGEQPAAEELAPPPAPRPAPPTEPPATSAPADDGWVLQITALRDRDAAEALVKRLADKGYPAFLVDPVPGEPVALHRVRVGRYTDRAEAERIARQLEREEQFTPLIIR